MCWALMKHLRGQSVLIVINIIFTAKATEDLIGQAQYIYEQSQSEKIADKYLDEMQAFIISMLSSFPKSGRVASEFGVGVRKLVYQRYSILYKIISKDEVVILTLYRENIPYI